MEPALRMVNGVGRAVYHSGAAGAQTFGGARREVWRTLNCTAFWGRAGAADRLRGFLPNLLMTADRAWLAFQA